MERLREIGQIREIGHIREIRERKVRRRLTALIGAAAAALLLASAARLPAQAPETFRYSLEVGPPGSGSRGGATWHVFQGPEGAALVPSRRGASRDTAWAIAHDRVTGGLPYQIHHADGLLTPIWEPESAYRPNVEVSGGRTAMVLRPLTWDLIRGSSDRRVAGRSTEHHVVTASVVLVALPPPALEGLGTDSARVTTRTDLWIDRSLPFSWMPFAVWGNRALTLAQPVADAGLRGEVGPRLRELGLPLRMETRVTVEPYGDPDYAFSESSRSVHRVTDLQPVDPPAVPSRFLRYERRNPSQ